MNGQYDDFELKQLPEETYAGDANKIKLKIASYATILEVERAYLEEKRNELAKQIAENSAGKDASAEEKAKSVEKIQEIIEELKDVNSTLESFMEKREKFLDIAKKALRLPESNLNELEKNGKTVFKGETISKEALESKLDVSFEEAQKPLINEENNEPIFSSIDPTVIREEVEKAIYSNEKGEDGLTAADYIDKNLTDKNFASETTYAAGNIKEKLEQPISEDTINSMFDAEGTVEPEITPQDDKDHVEKPLEVSDDYFVHFDTPVQAATKVEPSSFSGFDDDKDMEEFIANLNAEKEDIKARIQDSKARGVELDNTNKGLDQELNEANTSLEAAMKRKEIAEKRKKYFELAMPEVEELRAQEAEENKANSLKEQQIAEKRTKLDSTNTKTASYNQEADAIEKEVEEIIRKMQNPDGDGQLGGSGQKMKF